MTTGLSYDGSVSGTISYVNQVAELAVVSPTDPNYTAILPAMITYAENRMYRDIDLLSTQISITGYTLTVGNRSLSIPQGTVVTTQQINILTPVGSTNPNTATRNQCVPVTKEFVLFWARTRSSIQCRNCWHISPRKFICVKSNDIHQPLFA